MPSQSHDAQVQILKNRPPMAAKVLQRVCNMSLPSHSGAHTHSADLTEVQPAEYRADLVILLTEGDMTVGGIIVEVQLQRDERKGFAWPAYSAVLRSQIKCPVTLLVIAEDEAVAEWAARPIDVGNGALFTPAVLRSSNMPMVTDVEEAMADPEFAVLSAMLHGKRAEPNQAARIAVAAQAASQTLDEDRSRLYVDLVLNALSDAARQELPTVLPFKYEYQSDFAKHYVAEGRMEGRVEGRIELITDQLIERFGTSREAIQAKLKKALPPELEAIGKRLLTASNLAEALGEVPVAS